MSTYGGDTPQGGQGAGATSGQPAAPRQYPPPPPAPPYLGKTTVPPLALPPRHDSETKPFFLTSEFAVIIVTIVALGITAAADNSIDSRFFWIAAVALVAAYVLSRGIAKSGTKSRAWDPREQLRPPQ